MRIAVETSPSEAELVALYDSVQWSGYTKDPAKLARAVAGSHVALTARDDDGTLIGLARTVSDGESICYVQDLLVHPAHQGSGIGSALLTQILERYADCRFLALATDAANTLDGERWHHFYRRMGLVLHEEQGLAAFARRIPR